MARPLKNGLDYFPFDTKPDIKMNAIIRKYGATGLGCLVSIYQKIYDNGYFIHADFDFIEDLCLELRIENEDYLKEFIKFCVRKKIFHAGFYDAEKILTSNGIQRRFIEATKRRKCLHDASIYFINADINPVNVGDNGVNDDNSTQRKGKESKGEESKGNKVKSKPKNDGPENKPIDPQETAKPKPRAFEQFFEHFPKKFNPMCIFTKSSFFEAVSIAGSEDEILSKAAMYADYFTITEQPLQYAAKAQDWLESQAWRTDWIDETKKFQNKNGKKLSNSRPSEIKKGELF